MMSSHISCCATFYLLILHQYKLCIACRCSVFSWFLLALKSDIKHSTVSVYLTSNRGENYLSNCQLEWCSTFVHPLNFCVRVCEFQPLFFTREKVVPSDPHCFFFFWFTVLLFDSSGLLEGIKGIPPLPISDGWSLPPLRAYFSLELIRTGSHFLSLLS